MYVLLNLPGRGLTNILEVMERESKDSGEGSHVNSGAEGVWRPRRLPVDR